MEAILFGTGQISKKALPFIEAQYHILYAVDNNDEIWGTTFQSYEVKSPDNIEKCDCNIIIASTKYDMDIVKQLQQIGIGQGRIYLCRSFQTDDTYQYEIYPLLEENVLHTGIPLVHYDLCHTKDSESSFKKVLVACSFFSSYTKQVLENISKRYKDIEFSLLTNAKESKENIASEQLKHIYYFQTMADLKTILEELPIYDSIQLLWIEQEWSYFYKSIRKKCRRLNLNVGGSDFYRLSIAKREFKRALIACADTITAETIKTIEDFELFYRQDIKGKMGLLPFGIEVLEYINQNRGIPKDEIREKFHIPKDKIVVTCGHNANNAHQHVKIVEALNRLSETIKQQVVFVFPMTYPQGMDDYIDTIRDRLEALGAEYVILTEYMDFQNMAQYALLSDIMLHVQTTDQLSSTMLEEMYAGSIVIAGSWLPYQSLHKMGIYFYDVHKVSDITHTLEEIVNDIDTNKQKCKTNSEIIWKHSSWEVLASKWHALWK